MKTTTHSKIRPVYLVAVFAALGLLAACTNQNGSTKEEPMKPDAPAAKKADTLLKEHGQTRVDPYFWMRLSDEQKRAEDPDEHTQEVFDYLNAENEYTQKMMAHTETFQENLFEEITGRIKQTDESVPYFSNGYYYYTRYEEKKEYPIYCRKKNNLDRTGLCSPAMIRHLAGRALHPARSAPTPC